LVGAVDPPDDLLNHLIGSQQQRGWDGEPEGFGGFEVDNQLELGGLLNGKVARLCTLRIFPT
jgi:hypothetical protein